MSNANISYTIVQFEHGNVVDRVDGLTIDAAEALARQKYSLGRSRYNCVMMIGDEPVAFVYERIGASIYAQVEYVRFAPDGDEPVGEVDPILEAAITDLRNMESQYRANVAWHLSQQNRND
ncbi:hypothetical protein ACSI5F_03780 [Ralstonia pseudosolanacearum]|uniref:hypothetical protein n=1 Tax=Ralstonia pseudosolanacearum TaxID=1310165 RepID=UPI003EE369CD